MRHLFLDDLSRNDGNKGVIAGRGVVMTSETSTCHNCGKQGHCARNCEGSKESNNSKSTGVNDKQKNKESSQVKKGSNDTAEQKWCSVHKTTSHDDAHGAPRPSENDNAHIASYAAVLSASSPPANDDEKPSLNFDDDLDKGFAFSGLAAGSDVGVFTPTSTVSP